MQGIMKIPPHRLEFEEVVLGALMLEREAWHAVEDILTAECFYSEPHRHVFAAIKALHQKNRPVDILTVTNELRATGKLDEVGGAFYISELTNRITSAANIEYHALEIVSAYQLRELLSIAQTVQSNAMEANGNPFDILSDLEKSINNAFILKIGGRHKSMSDVVSEVQQNIITAFHSDWNAVQGISTGFKALDSTFGGLEPSNLIIMAARPGMGKTSLAMKIAAINAAKNIPVAVFSLEMSSEQLIKRLISDAVSVSYEELSKGHISNIQKESAIAASEVMRSWPLFIEDDSLTIAEIRMKCRRWFRTYGIKLVVIDYLQLIRPDERGKNQNREQEISTISSSLKSLAKELNIPILALAQLSRQVEQRGGSKKPILSDLRESGSIEQDADQVFFIYRPEYYGIMEDADGCPLDGVAEIISAKNRHGRTGSVNLLFEGRFTRFSDMPSTDNFPQPF